MVDNIMRSLAICIISLVSTFLVGTGMHHSFLKTQHSTIAVDIRAAVPLVMKGTAQTAFPSNWEKVDIGKLFSVYLPPEMKGGSDGWDSQVDGGGYIGSY